MTPSESPWTRKYWQLIARHEILIRRREEGYFWHCEWLELIEDMEAHGMWALANDIRYDMNNRKIGDE